MNHKDIKELAFYYWRKELNPDEMATVERHLSECIECKEFYDEVQRIEGLLSGAPKLKAPPTIRVEIMKEVEKIRIRRQIFRKWVPVLIPVIAVLVLLLVNFPRPESQLTATTVTVDLLSPTEGDVILRDDFAVIAALYPSLPFEAELKIDSVKVSENVIKGDGYLLVKDLTLDEGYHTLSLTIEIPRVKYSTTIERFFYIVGRGEP